MKLGVPECYRPNPSWCKQPGSKSIFIIIFDLVITRSYINQPSGSNNFDISERSCRFVGISEIKSNFTLIPKRSRCQYIPNAFIISSLPMSIEIIHIKIFKCNFRCCWKLWPFVFGRVLKFSCRQMTYMWQFLIGSLELVDTCWLSPNNTLTIQHLLSCSFGPTFNIWLSDVPLFVFRLPSTNFCSCRVLLHDRMQMW